MTDNYRVEPTEWSLDYLGQPIGMIRRRSDGFHAKLGAEYLGVYRSGDAASEAVWRRYVEQSAARHAHASITHGGHDRHRAR